MFQVSEVRGPYYKAGIYHLLPRYEWVANTSGRCNNHWGKGLRQFLRASGERKVDKTFRENLLKVALRIVMLSYLGHFLLRVTNHDLCVVDTRDGATDKDEVQVGVNTHDSKVLRGDALAAKSASHLLTGPNTAGVLYDVRTLDRRSRQRRGDLLDGHQWHLLPDGR